MGENKTSLDRLINALVAGHLTDDEEMARLDVQPSIHILPDANVVKIGGQSFIDRGRVAVLPLIDELVENLPRHKMIIGTGAGTRERGRVVGPLGGPVTGGLPGPVPRARQPASQIAPSRSSTG